MPRRKSLRSQLYRAARDLGNVEAVEHGGASGGAKRYARRAVYRKTNTVTGDASGRTGLGAANAATYDERDELCERHHLPGGCVDSRQALVLGFTSGSFLRALGLSGGLRKR